jgi:hypothetical protein
MLSIEKGADEISKAIQYALENEDGCLIGRNGTIELEQMIFSNKFNRAVLETNAGIFPSEIYGKWINKSTEATRGTDVLATGWYEPLKDVEQVFLEGHKCKAKQIPLRSLEPYYVALEKRWTALLSGQTISVVSCFTETMKKQALHLDKVWPSETRQIWPSDIRWNWVQTGHPPSVARGVNEWPSQITNSMEAVDWIVSEVVRQGSRFALIGCGGIGMLVGLELKKRGVIAIVLGGAIQVLFGIKGGRWKNHSVISKFWNDFWVNPSEAEKPNGANSIEGGCYWV